MNLQVPTSSILNSLSGGKGKRFCAGTFLTLLAVCCVATQAFAQEKASVPSLSYEQLHRIPIDKLPQKVLVTEMYTTHGNASANGYAYVLDSIPSNWQLHGEGKLGVSQAYSRAGAKSIRWDWKAGDVLRIKDAGIVTNVRVGYTGWNAKSEEVAPFALSIFQEKPLPKNTPINIYCKRTTDRPGEDLKLTKSRYFANFSGTWYRMGGVALKQEAMVFGQGNHINVIDAMPEGVAEPEVDEIVIQAPQNVASGTFYLDRLLTLAEVPDQKVMDARAKTEYLALGFTKDGKMTDGRAWPMELTVEEDIATVGITDKPIGAREFNQANTGYYGHNAEKPPVPETLTPGQQAYIKRLREEFFVAPKPLAPESEQYKKIEQQAEEVLARDCVKLAGGRYKFKETLNFGGDRIYFAGDHCTARKHVYNFPESIDRNALRDRDVKSLFLRYGQWYTLCPDSETAEALFKAYLDWYRYQVSTPLLGTMGGSDSSITGHFAKYGGSWLIKDARQMIAVLRSKGTPEDIAYANYIGETIVWMTKVQSYTFAVDPLPGISREWSAEATYYGLFYEPDDRKFFQMLKASQESFTRTFSISEIKSRGMIKPDYSFYHHGHVSYWGGNFFAHIQKARQFADTPLDFSQTVRRNLAWYIPRYCFGSYNFPTAVKGGQESTNNTLRTKHWAKDLLAGGHGHSMVYGMDKPTEFSIDKFPSRDVFEYLYHQDWQELPSAKKFMAGVLGMTTHHPPELRETLVKEYPKLASLQPQRDVHLSFNWTGATSYSTGMTRVQLGSYCDKDATPSRPHGRWSWNRGYGCLYILDNDRAGSRPPLGSDYEGYSWSKSPGVTMPAVTDEEYIKHHTMDGKKRSADGVELNTIGGIGNGSLTFNETEESFGQYGNYSFQTLKSENLKIWKDLFGIDGVAGKKSYHICGDKVVCLGSDYQANTDRPMETILFQETLDPIMWKVKNPGRWNPDDQAIVVNGEKFDAAVKAELPLAEPNYVISPFGHAWIIPGGQSGNLKIDWRERETLFNYRLGVHSVTPGQEMTKGTGVIAMLDQGPSSDVSSHHYCLLLNSDGKTRGELEAYTKSTIKNLKYQVIRQDGAAHAVVFDSDEGPLHSYIIYESDTPLDLPNIAMANKRLNIMFRKDTDGTILLCVSDPQIDIETDRTSPNFERSRSREIKLTFASEVRAELISSTSGLPQTNPPLDANLENNTLSYTTRNGVTDTFRIRVR